MAGRHALIVANDVYEHEGLSRLAAPAHDARALESVLADPQIGRFQVTVVRNQPAHVVRREIANFFADRRPDDFLLLHFSCHGLKGASGALYFAGADTVPTRLSATAVSARFVDQEMTESRARRIALFLDCCYGGAFSRGMRARAADAIDGESAFPAAASGADGAGDGRGRMVITASGATEYAFEDDRLARADRHGPSVFTGALVHGLRTGEADTGGDGLVDLDELYDYVYTRVRATTRHQTPQKWVDASGKLVVGWVPLSARLKGAPLPADLVARTDGRAPADRLAGVRELRRILLDDDVERAVGAMDLLHRLTGDDSKEVSAAATAALQEAQLKAVPGRVELGAAPEGGFGGGAGFGAGGGEAGPPATHTVRLVGSPLARVFQATTTASWITVEHSGPFDPSGGWVRIGVDSGALAEHSGPLHGSVNIVNRLGEFEIPVTAPARGSLWPRTAGTAVPRLPRPGWLLDRRVPPALAAAAVVAWPLSEASAAGDMNLAGAVFFLLRSALLLAGALLLDRPGTKGAVGRGLVAGSGVYYLAFGLGLLAVHADVYALLGLAATVLLLAGLVLRLWPHRAVLKGMRPTAAAANRLTYVTGAALVGLFVMSFVSLPETDVTAVDVIGLPAVLCAVLPMGALCVAATSAGLRGARARLSAVAAIASYYGPELYFLLGSLFGREHVYVGNTLVSPYPSPGYILVQAALVAALALPAALPLWRGWTPPPKAPMPPNVPPPPTVPPRPR
ncbi:caspase domain-containing protein [Streptomyces sp. KL2]|uniref:caspase family protein n=1 Tax=Streptomyces sp. KL2 TaxID=3050126 RepID=UPI00397B67A8